MTARLAGKTVLVTGAGSGIGRTVANTFVLQGARVVYSDRDRATVFSVAQAQGDLARGIHLDVTSESSVAGAFATLRESGWAPDVVIANAGVQLFGRDAATADVEMEAWRRTLDVNLTGTFLTVKHAVRSMLQTGGGSIICTGSPTGINGEGAGFAAYSSSKGGIHALVRSTAMAYAKSGIRVNTVVPGYTETKLVRTISTDDDARAGIIGRTPLGRPGTPWDVTGIMVFLASDESDFATGSVFTVDGGMTSL